MVNQLLTGLIIILASLIICLSPVIVNAQTANAPAFIEGKHYQRLSSAPAITRGGSKQIDFYFYPKSLASYQVDMALNALIRQQSDIRLNKIPYVHNQHWRIYAKAYLISQSLGISEPFLAELYTAIHQHQLVFERPEDFTQHLPVLAPHTESFLTDFTSAHINQQLQAQQKITAQLPVKGVPSIILNNTWLIDASMASSTNQLMAIIKFLLNERNHEY